MHCQSRSGIKNSFISTICTSSKSNKQITIRLIYLRSNNRSITFIIGIIFLSICAISLLFILQFITLTDKVFVLLVILAKFISLRTRFLATFIVIGTFASIAIKFIFCPSANRQCFFIRSRTFKKHHLLHLFLGMQCLRNLIRR